MYTMYRFFWGSVYITRILNENLIYFLIQSNQGKHSTSRKYFIAALNIEGFSPMV